MNRLNVKYYLSLILVLSSISSSMASEIPDWENPQIISRNKIDGHAFIRPFASENNALSNSPSERIQSLNGKWQFNWVGHPDKRPADFYKTNYDVSEWAEVDVPGNWQTQGYGRPIYTNHPYPFARDKPRVMTEPPANFTNFYDRNPVGSYKRKFFVAKGLKNKQTFIEFQGVKSAFYLWVNGEKVGYSQGSMTPAEFDITQYLIEGENDLAVEVYRWSDGSYLEGQDMWRFSGIFRSVNLIARPEVFLQDFLITTDLKNNYQDSTLNVNFELAGIASSKAINSSQIKVDVFSPKGKLIASKQAKSSRNGSKFTGKVEFDFEGVSLWSAESPTLYSVMLTVSNQKGQAVEYIPWSFGFKESKIENNQFWVNGKSIKIKGVNRHEHHPRMGRTLDLKTMELDIKLMKQGNFNLVRTSHYPNDHRWYQLANKYGLYVLDDANQESHGYYKTKIVGDDPDWTIAHVDRAASMVHTNKNYSSIVIWSLGNEGGYGRNFTAMRAAVLAIDTTRPILSDTDPSASDFVERSYRALEGKHIVDKFIAESEKVKKPFIQREYAHAMGNSLGNFQEHWDKIYATENYVGGAIWDWVDQGLARVKNTAMVSYGKDPTKLSLNPKREVWSYGGDFGDSPTDAEFLLNGIVSSDRNPFPSYYEAKKVQQNVLFEKTDDPLTIKVSNRFDFTNLNAYDYVWQVKSQEKGQSKVIATGKLSLSLAPGSSTLVKVPFTYNGNDSANELILELSAHTKQDTVWANKGFDIAFEQFVLAAYQYPALVASKGKKVKVSQTDDAINIATNNGTLSIDNITGELTSYIVAEQELLIEPLAPYFWKPVNNNQARSKFIVRMAPWLNAAAHRQVSSVKVNQLNENLVEVKVTARLIANHALYELTYRINGEGSIQVTADYTPDPERIQHKFMPKFGMKMVLDQSLSQIDWYGRGPFENYPDRKTAAKIGNYQKTLDGFQVPYVSATDSTNRGDVREASFANKKVKLSILGMQPFNFRAWPYNESDLYSFNTLKVKNLITDQIRRKHYYDLPDRGYINVNLDSAIHGVGGDDSWGGETMKKYHIRADIPHRFSFVLKAEVNN